MIINDKHTPIRQEFLEHVKGLFYTDQNVLPSATGDKFKDVPRGFHHGDDRTVKRMRRKRQNWATSFFPHCQWRGNLAFPFNAGQICELM